MFSSPDHPHIVRPFCQTGKMMLDENGIPLRGADGEIIINPCGWRGEYASWDDAVRAADEHTEATATQLGPNTFSYHIVWPV